LNVLSWSFERSFGVAENNSAAKSSEKLESAAKKKPDTRWDFGTFQIEILVL
jgi:hypothetical protein